MSFRTVEWVGGGVRLIDQTRLPLEVVYVDYSDHADLARAIVDMVVRGAPAIGVTAAYGVALAARKLSGETDFAGKLEGALRLLASTRPTAVNLFWAIERMRRVIEAKAGAAPGEVAEALLAEAHLVHDEDLAACKAMGRFGAELLPDEVSVLTHCNAGGLATAGYGTALGVIRAAVEMGKKVKVFADETRPLLQGARLTAWELASDGIDVTLISDNMAGHLMKLGRVDVVVTGADRIAANGDSANKIGTYPLSIVAKAHRVPFYIAAPLSTIDMKLAHGDQIPIEERSPEEVTSLGGRRTAPPGVKVFNPAFDVTPAANIAAIITEKGVARPDYNDSLAKLFGNGK